MKPSVPYALQIWFSSAILGSFIFGAVEFIINGWDAGAIVGIWGLFLISCIISIFFSMPALLLLIFILAIFENFTNNKIAFKVFLCFICYALCFGTLYFVAIQYFNLFQNFSDALSLEILVPYSVALTIGIFYFGKNYFHPKPPVEADV